MYDIQHLESEWRRYKRKQFLFPFFLFIVALILMALGYIFWPEGVSPDSNKTKTHMETLEEKSTKTEAEKPSPKPLSPQVPSTVNVSPQKKGWHMTFAGDEAPKKSAATPSPTKHVEIQVTSKKTEFTVKEIESRFNFAKDKDDALFLARYYYDKKQYKKALNWALETNKLDSDIEESWLLFGRAKAKLGLRMEAIRVLQAYYDRTGSKKAKKLLDRIRRGGSF